MRARIRALDKPTDKLTGERQSGVKPGKTPRQIRPWLTACLGARRPGLRPIGGIPRSSRHTLVPSPWGRVWRSPKTLRPSLPSD